MRLPEPNRFDPFVELLGQRVILSVDGQRIRGWLLSYRDDFVTLVPDRGPRVSFNRYEVSSIRRC